MSFQFFSARSLGSNLHVLQCKNFEQLNILKKNKVIAAWKSLAFNFLCFYLKFYTLLSFFAEHLIIALSFRSSKVRLMFSNCMPLTFTCRYISICSQSQTQTPCQAYYLICLFIWSALCFRAGLHFSFAVVRLFDSLLLRRVTSAAGTTTNSGKL